MLAQAQRQLVVRDHPRVVVAAGRRVANMLVLGSPPAGGAVDRLSDGELYTAAALLLLLAAAGASVLRLSMRIAAEFSPERSG